MEFMPNLFCLLLQFKLTSRFDQWRPHRRRSLIIKIKHVNLMRSQWVLTVHESINLAGSDNLPSSIFHRQSFASVYSWRLDFCRPSPFSVMQVFSCAPYVSDWCRCFSVAPESWRPSCLESKKVIMYSGLRENDAGFVAVLRLDFSRQSTSDWCKFSYKRIVE